MAETSQDKQGRGAYGSYPSDDLRVNLLVLSLIMWCGGWVGPPALRDHAPGAVSLRSCCPRLAASIWCAAGLLRASGWAVCPGSAADRRGLAVGTVLRRRIAPDQGEARCSGSPARNSPRTGAVASGLMS